MADKYGNNTKTDVIDFIINFLLEHEKQMDQTLQRLEKMIEILQQSMDHNNGNHSYQNSELQSKIFTVTITNPENFHDQGSLNIEWNTKNETTANSKPSGDVLIRRFLKKRNEKESFYEFRLRGNL